jgi:hypothetical protein
MTVAIPAAVPAGRWPAALPAARGTRQPRRLARLSAMRAPATQGLEKMTRRFASLLTGAFVLLTMAAASSTAAADLPTTTLTIGGHTLVAEIAATPDQRATGLMHRFSLKPDHGMLFVFERPERQAFWMKNTFIPQSIAFIDSAARILNIEDMAPQTENSHWSKGAALYALEMRKGWFAERGIKPGDRLEGTALRRAK